MKSRTLRRGAYILLSRIFVLVVLVFNSNIGFSEDLAQTLYNNNSQYIVQIQVIELVSSKKSSIGSGFLISGDGLIATNYHVISSYIHQPDKYRVEYTNEDNENGDLKVEDIDVINDLAILKSAISSEVYLELSQKLPENGEPIYSMGNPLDLGSAVVPGTYNGYISSSYYHRIHFTGSINPGMSGGPVFNQLNEVIGVNVATSGNQISFLIPVDKLKKLLNEYLARNEDPIDFNKRIREQLIDNQKKLMKSIFSIDWGREKLGDAEVFSKLSEFVTCWGSKKEQKKKERFSVVSIDCQKIGRAHV